MVIMPQNTGIEGLLNLLSFQGETPDTSGGVDFTSLLSLFLCGDAQHVDGENSSSLRTDELSGISSHIVSESETVDGVHAELIIRTADGEKVSLPVIITAPLNNETDVSSDSEINCNALVLILNLDDPESYDYENILAVIGHPAAIDQSDIRVESYLPGVEDSKAVSFVPGEIRHPEEMAAGNKVTPEVSRPVSKQGIFETQSFEDLKIEAGMIHPILDRTAVDTSKESETVSPETKSVHGNRHGNITLETANPDKVSAPLHEAGISNNVEQTGNGVITAQDTKALREINSVSLEQNDQPIRVTLQTTPPENSLSPTTLQTITPPENSLSPITLQTITQPVVLLRTVSGEIPVILNIEGASQTDTPVILMISALVSSGAHVEIVLKSDTGDKPLDMSMFNDVTEPKNSGLFITEHTVASGEADNVSPGVNHILSDTTKETDSNTIQLNEQGKRIFRITTMDEIDKSETHPLSQDVPSKGDAAAPAEEITNVRNEDIRQSGGPGTVSSSTSKINTPLNKPSNPPDAVKTSSKTLTVNRQDIAEPVVENTRAIMNADNAAGIISEPNEAGSVSTGTGNHGPGMFSLGSEANKPETTANKLFSENPEAALTDSGRGSNPAETVESDGRNSVNTSLNRYTDTNSINKDNTPLNIISPAESEPQADRVETEAVRTGFVREGQSAVTNSETMAEEPFLYKAASEPNISNTVNTFGNNSDISTDVKSAGVTVEDGQIGNAVAPAPVNESHDIHSIPENFRIAESTEPRMQTSQHPDLNTSGEKSVSSDTDARAFPLTAKDSEISQGLKEKDDIRNTVEKESRTTAGLPKGRDSNRTFTPETNHAAEHPETSHENPLPSGVVESENRFDVFETSEKNPLATVANNVQHDTGTKWEKVFNEAHNEKSGITAAKADRTDYADIGSNGRSPDSAGGNLTGDRSQYFETPQFSVEASVDNFEKAFSAGEEKPLDNKEAFNGIAAADIHSESVLGTENKSARFVLFNENEITPETEHRIVDTIVRSARFMIGRGQSRAEIKLEPPNLGKLKLEIVTENSKVTGRITVESAEVKDIVQNNIADLKEQLSQNGLRVESFDVQVGHNNGADAWANRELSENLNLNLRRNLYRTGVNSVEDSPGSERAHRGKSLDSDYIDLWV